MTSELRPAEGVWMDAISASQGWGLLRLTPERSRMAAVAVIEADREAVRAYWYRQGKDDGWQCREEQAAELAKYKALAETLAGAMRRIHKTASHPTNPSRNLVDIKSVSDLALHKYDAALRQYKEARDA